MHTVHLDPSEIFIQKHINYNNAWKENAQFNFKQSKQWKECSLYTNLHHFILCSWTIKDLHLLKYITAFEYLTSQHKDLTSRHDCPKRRLFSNYVDLSDHYVDLSDHYVDLSENYVNLSHLYFDLSGNDVDLSDIKLTSRWQLITETYNRRAMSQDPDVQTRVKLHMKKYIKARLHSKFWTCMFEHACQNLLCKHC